MTCNFLLKIIRFLFYLKKKKKKKKAIISKHIENNCFNLKISQHSFKYALLEKVNNKFL